MGDQALARIGNSLAALGNLLARRADVTDDVPAALLPSLMELRTRYDYEGHSSSDIRSPNADLIDRLGLTEYLADRFAVVGTPDDCIRKVQSLRSRGIDSLWLSRSPGPDAAAFLGLWGNSVKPHLDGA